MQIRNKKKFFELWEEGVLGNRTLIFRTPEEAFAVKGIKQIGFREIGKAGGGAWTMVSHLPKKEFEEEVRRTYLEWKNAGRNFIMDSSVPNEHSIMQGEICRTYNGLESFIAVGHALPPMRMTMAAGLHKHRGYLETRLLLEQYMDPNSRDDLEALFEQYPEAAIEFTCFEVNTGVFPRRNTIFWEVRNY